MLFRSDRKSTRLNSSHLVISYAVFCLKKKKKIKLLTADGGVFFNTNSAHPYENATPLSSFFQVFLMLVIPFFFFNDTATTEIYTLSLHDALPICTRMNSNHLVISYAVFCLEFRRV